MTSPEKSLWAQKIAGTMEGGAGSSLLRRPVDYFAGLIEDS
jgi:hypothetical protein